MHVLKLIKIIEETYASTSKYWLSENIANVLSER